MKDLLEEAKAVMLGEAAAVKNVKDLVRMLQSSDFGMSKSGGNGEAARDSSGNLVIKDLCYIGCTAKLQGMIHDWTNPGGTYAKYFKDAYGITFSRVKATVDDEGTMYGKKVPMRDGSVLTLTLSVNFN